MINDQRATDVRSAVLTCLVEFTGNDALYRAPDSASLADCGIDSLAVLEFVTLIEDKFGVEFDEASFTSANFRTVGQIVNVLQRAGQRRPE